MNVCITKNKQTNKQDYRLLIILTGILFKKSSKNGKTKEGEKPSPFSGKQHQLVSDRKLQSRTNHKIELF